MGCLWHARASSTGLCTAFIHQGTLWKTHPPGMGALAGQSPGLVHHGVTRRAGVCLYPGFLCQAEYNLPIVVFVMADSLLPSCLYLSLDPEKRQKNAMADTRDGGGFQHDQRLSQCLVHCQSG